MAACSANQLNFIPATGAGLTNGVIQVTVPTAITSASDPEAIMKEANQIIVAAKAYDYTFAMFVMSDTPSSWGDTAGVAYLPGELSWFNDKSAVDTEVR